jgi:RHS repeat-associated protein
MKRFAAASGQRRPWENWFAFTLALPSLLIATVCAAQGTPGNPLGSQTGDSAGAYVGLASSPEANLFTGIAQTSVPIEVPPGRLGLAPVLALSYSSSSGPSVYGYGWTLPLPRVHRSTRYGVPRYDDSDEFVLEMPGVLLELERVPASQRGFRAKVESSFMRIGFDEAENRWKVVDKLGVTFSFGTTAAARTGRGSSRDDTFAWLLERIEDSAGNRIDLAWRDGGPDGTSSGLPSRIEYGANARTAAAHFAAVEFVWTGLARGNPPVVSWREGHAETIDVRLAAIETTTHALRARRYDFSHEEDAVTGDLRLVGVTLSAFAENAFDDVQLPSTVFVYAPSTAGGWPTAGSTNAEGTFEVEGPGVLRYDRNDITFDSIDINGDSLIDRFDTAGKPPTTHLGNGRSFAPSRTWNWPSGSSAPRMMRRSDNDGNLLNNVFDLDGDGFADVVDSYSGACSAPIGNWCVWRGSASGFSGTPLRWPSPVGKLRATASGGAKIVSDLVDIDGDGRLDLVDASPFDATTGSRFWKVHRNTGTGFAASKSFSAPVEWLAKSNSGRLVYGLFDINADSLPDLVSADVGNTGSSPGWSVTLEWNVYLNHGDGLSSIPVSWPIDTGTTVGLPNFLNLHAEDGSVIADLFDITGDGRPDLVRRLRPGDYVPDIVHGCHNGSRCPYVEDEDQSAVSVGFCCYNLLVFANTGSSFSAPQAWTAPTHGLRANNAFCPADEYCYALVYDFDFFDFDGDGLVDFIERYTAASRPSSWLVHPHPLGVAYGGARPNLLLAMRNGVGGETLLRYGVAASTPDTRLPFAHWIVREREVRDSNDDATLLRSSFAYRGGYFDPVDREMRGFAVVQETGPVGTIHVREYHQDHRRAGRVRRVTTLMPPPCVAADPANPDDPCSPSKFALGSTTYDWPAGGPVLLRSETDVPQHDGRAVENLRVTTTYEHDDLGNVTRRTTQTPLAPPTTTSTEYFRRIADRPGGMPDVYVVAKPLRARTEQEGRASPLVERAFEYQWQGPTPGVLTASSTCVTWDAGECTRWSTRSFSYDGYGNMTVAKAADGATSRTEYDADGLFAVRSVDPVGLVTSSRTDPRTGKVTQTTAPNGNRANSRYDGIGRLTRTWGPGTRENAPLRRLRYAPGELGVSPPRVVTFDASSGTATAFFDGLGRPVATKKATADATGPVTLVSGLRRYDERGLVIAEALPFDSASLDTTVLTETFDDAPAWIESQYDAAGRLIETRAPDGSTVRIDPSAPGILRTDDANSAGRAWPGSVTLEIFDGLGRMILRDSCSAAPVDTAPYECPAGALLRRRSWVHDALGRVEEERTSALGVAAGDAVTRIARDGLGSRIEVFHSNAGTWRFENDDGGRVVAVEKPDGTRISMTYDASGRLTRRRSASSSASYRYDSAGGGIGKIGRIRSRTHDAKFWEELTYDDRGRTETRYRRIAPRGEKRTELTTAYTYDDFDRRTATRFVDWDADGDETVFTTYDAYGRPASLRTVNTAYVERALYDSTDRRVRTDYGNGVSALVEFEVRSNAARTAGYLRCARTTATSTADDGACVTSPLDLEARRYVTYDRNGNLIAASDMRYDDADPRHEDFRYQYDALGRIVSAGTPASERQQFAFDPLGNLTRNGSVQMEYLDADHPSRMTAIVDGSGEREAVVYDEAGRRTDDGDRHFEYDDFDRIASVSFAGETATELGYMDTGERVLRRDIAGGTLEIELGDGIRVVGDELERTIVFAGTAVAVERRTIVPSPLRGSPSTPRPIPGAVSLSFLHHDHQQSVRVVTNEAGLPVELHRYRAFGAHRRLLDGDGQDLPQSTTRFSYTGHVEDAGDGLMYFGARYYDARTGSFVTLDPQMQFASPYAYSAGNPVLGRDADGSLFGLTAIELLAVAVGTASFVDSIVATGDLGHSLTAGVFAGFSVYLSGQISTAIARPLAQAGHPYLQMAASVATDGFQAINAVEAIEDGRYAGGIVAAGMLAASLIGIESAGDPGPGTTPEEQYSRHGIEDRGVIDGKRVIDVNGICATRPGCLTNTLIAARENIRVLFGGKVACVGGCEHVVGIAEKHLGGGEDVLLRCNSFGSIKCLGAIETDLRHYMANDLHPGLSVEMSGSPLLRPPHFENLTYQVNLFDPVVWVGTWYSTPFRSDVVLGTNWWVPAPVIVHHSRMYERPFHQALGDMLP